MKEARTSKSLYNLPSPPSGACVLHLNPKLMHCNIVNELDEYTFIQPNI